MSYLNLVWYFFANFLLEQKEVQKRKKLMAQSQLLAKRN